MTNEEMIESIATWYELPVEQVALIWSVICHMDGNYVSFDGDISPIVRAFIEEKMV